MRGAVVAVLGKRDVVRTASWLRSGLRAARAVGRIESPSDAPLATGFLIAGDQIGEQFAGLPIFLTANYVFNDYGSGRGDHVVFEGLYDDPDASAEVSIRDVMWSSSELHVAVCLLDSMPGDLDGLRAAAAGPALDVEGGSRAWVVGYPGGGSLSFALQDNAVIAVDEPMIHYRTATEGGSGGSPVFNAYWEVMAVHVLGSHDEGSNAGTLLHVVLERAKDALRLKSVAQQPETRASSGASARRHSTLSAFISYNSADVQFAERLFTALQGRGVRCWWDKRNMAPGDLIDAGIQSGINESDRILLCCSQHSLSSSAWVDAELEVAFERERAIHESSGAAESVVIPLDLDGYLFDGFTGPKGPQLRKRSAADFTQWRESASFETAVDDLLRALVGDNSRSADEGGSGDARYAEEPGQSPSVTQKAAGDDNIQIGNAGQVSIRRADDR